MVASTQGFTRVTSLMFLSPKRYEYISSTNLVNASTDLVRHRPSGRSTSTPSLPKAASASRRSLLSRVSSTAVPAMSMVSPLRLKPFTRPFLGPRTRPPSLVLACTRSLATISPLSTSPSADVGSPSTLRSLTRVA